MNNQRLQKSAQEFGNIAFAVVVVAGYSSWLTSSEFKFDSITLIAMVSLGLVYLGLGAWDEQRRWV